MGAGKPVIITDVGGCSEAVEENIYNCIDIPQRQHEDLLDVRRQLKIEHDA